MKNENRAFIGGPKMVIVVRKDLNMRKGKMIAQGAHAAVEQVLKGCCHPENREQIMTWWLDHGQKKIAVSVDSEAELQAIYDKALSSGIGATMIADSGTTEFHGVPTKTVVAIGPVEEDKVDAITGALKLL